jgi:NAD(P)-dependent dehydrogenase (short-subunit alcohol dehydrogenase family)
MANNIAVVVGVGRGLGWALVRRFSRADMSVVAASRRPQALSDAAKENLPNVHFRACDASAPTDVATLFETVVTEFGRPDLVVFNAGTYETGDVIDIHPDDFDRCWRVGCFGGFLVGRQAARLMLPAASGTIIFTGATASLRGSAGFANLAVPKFGLRALSQSMARELGPKGIHIAHVIIDGQIESERYEELLLKRGSDSLLAPEAIAEAYYSLHLQQRSAWTLELDLRPWTEKF